MTTIETIQSLNYMLALLGIVGFVIVPLLIVDLQTNRVLQRAVESWGMIVAFFITFGASALTLVYSEIFGIVPCGLCWFERIALYPQVVLIATALYYKDRMLPRHGIVLSGIGFLVSLYHHYIQMGGSEFIKCPTTGADCAKRFFFEFGFMTFPLMSAILFAFLIVLYLYMLKADRTSSIQ